MYSNSEEQLVGVPNVHGIGAVRIPQTLGEVKPTNVKVMTVPLPTKKPVPPTFKGTRPNMIALPGADPTLAWQWDDTAKTWRIITRAEGLRLLKAQGYVVTPAMEAVAKAATAPKPVAVAVKPVAKPAAPPTQPGRFVGEIFLPSNTAEHAWRYDGAVWRGISRSDAVKPTTPQVAANAAQAAKASSGSILDKIVAAVMPKVAQAANVPNGTNGTKLPTAIPPKPPSIPGSFIGMTFLPSNPAEHAWMWDGKTWRGIARSDALKPQATLDRLGIKTNVAANAQAAATAPTSLLDKLKASVTGGLVATGRAETSLIDKVVAKLSPPVVQPHPEVVKIAPGAAAPGYVNTTTGTPAKLPTKLDPDADGQVAPGKPAPPPTVGKPGTFPSTPLDPNGDGIVDATGKRAPPPTVGVPGTFPATPLDPNGDGIIDSTGATAPPPFVGQKGSFPSTPDDANGDGMNDVTGQPLHANVLAGLDLTGMAVPLLGMAAVLLLSGQKKGGTRHWA